MFRSYEDGEPVATIQIGKGMFASRNVLNIMRDLILRGSKHLVVRRWAEQIVAGLTCDYDKAHAVWEFVTDNSDYQRDPRGFEYIKTPLLILEEIAQGQRAQLDCDDMTVLSLALLASVGFHVTLRAASYRKDERLTHVYGLVFIPKDEVYLPLDCVAKNAGPGWQKTPYTKIMNWKVS